MSVNKPNKPILTLVNNEGYPTAGQKCPLKMLIEEKVWNEMSIGGFCPSKLEEEKK
jgi:hypothetical protein